MYSGTYDDDVKVGNKLVGAQKNERENEKVFRSIVIENVLKAAAVWLHDEKEAN